MCGRAVSQQSAQRPEIKVLCCVTTSVIQVFSDILWITKHIPNVAVILKKLFKIRNLTKYPRGDVQSVQDVQDVQDVQGARYCLLLHSLRGQINIFLGSQSAYFYYLADGDKTVSHFITESLACSVATLATLPSSLYYTQLT